MESWLHICWDGKLYPFSIILKIFMEKYFFKGKDFEDMLVLISEVLGTDDLFTYLNKYQMPVKKSTIVRLSS